MRSHTQRLMVCAASFAALCMGLAGCGSNTASTGGDSGEVVNLTYMHRLPDSEGMTLVKDIVAKWNKDHPTLRIAGGISRSVSRSRRRCGVPDWPAMHPKRTSRCLRRCTVRASPSLR